MFDKHSRAKYGKQIVDDEGQLVGRYAHAWGIVAGAAVGLVGSYMSADAASSAADQADNRAAISEARLQRAQQTLEQQIANLSALTPPNLQEFIKPYQQAVLVGQLTPEDAVVQMQQASSMAGITIPPAILSAQNMALTKMQQIADQGGLTAQDRAALAQIQDQQATASRGAQEAITQDAARRGVGGSGVELAQRLLANQAAATRGANAGLQVAADAEKRRMDAINNSATLSSNMRNQSFNEDAQKAQAQDAINRYNNMAVNTNNANNVAARNAAQAANLSAAQNVQQFNISQAQQEAAARAAAAQTSWQNLLNQRTTATNAAAGQATNAQNASIAANNAATTANNTAAATTGAAWQSAANTVRNAYQDYQDQQKKNGG